MESSYSRLHAKARKKLAPHPALNNTEAFWIRLVRSEPASEDGATHDSSWSDPTTWYWGFGNVSLEDTFPDDFAPWGTDRFGQRIEPNNKGYHVTNATENMERFVVAVKFPKNETSWFDWY